MKLHFRTPIVGLLALLVLGACSSNNDPFVPPPPPLSDDATLSGLTISAGELSPAFAAGTTAYTVTLGFLNEDISVTATINDAAATATINGAALTSGQASAPISLAEGANTIDIAVTAEDGSVNTYTITVTRESANEFAQSAYIKASNTDAGDLFSGNAVSLDGDTLAVGSRNEDSASTGVNGDEADNTASGSGAVYVFTRDAAGTWSQQAYVKASNTEAGDQFGWAVSVYGDTLAVGAFGEDSAGTGVGADEADNTAESAGAAYVFTRDGAGMWSQQAYIKASNAGAGDQFGRKLSLNGDTLAVAARLEASASTGVNGDETDNSAASSGAVYVFVRDGAGAWSQQAYVKASNTEANDGFGYSVSIDVDTLAVGARREDSAATGVGGDEADNTAADSGAAYVYTRDGAGAWSQQAYIKASNPDASDEFGTDVSINGDTLVVTAINEDSASTGVGGDDMDNSAADSGAAYVFMRDAAGAWTQEAYIKASNTDAGDLFGFDVEVRGNLLVVGAWDERSLATGVNGTQSDNGAPEKVGADYVFIKDSAGDWGQQLYLKPSNTDPGEVFTWVTVSNTTVAVGANGEDSAATGVDGDQSDNSASAAGAVYVFD